MKSKRLKLKRKVKDFQHNFDDYAVGKEKFNLYMRLNRKHLDKASESDREFMLFVSGFYQGCQHKTEEHNTFIPV